MIGLRCFWVLWLLLAGCAVTTEQEQPHGEHLDAADRLASAESPELRAVYQAGNDYFRKGDLDNALIEYDYAAYDGSAAAMLRLCVIHGYDDWEELAPARALFWCQRVARRGYPPAGQIAAYLFSTYWREE